MLLETMPLWALYLFFLVGIAIAILTWCSERFRKEFAIPVSIFMVLIRFSAAMIHVLSVVIYRTFYQ